MKTVLKYYESWNQMIQNYLELYLVDCVLFSTFQKHSQSNLSSCEHTKRDISLFERLYSILQCVWCHISFSPLHQKFIVHFHQSLVYHSKVYYEYIRSSIPLAHTHTLKIKSMMSLFVSHVKELFRSFACAKQQNKNCTHEIIE